jgi:DNA polymerase
MKPPENCKWCALCEGRTNVVMPDGDPSSPIAFVGEAPGAKEDAAGRPFVGSSGKVLTQLLEEEGLPRDKVFITNTVKCRPPGNREPTQEEMDACLPCLESELESRKVVVTLGRSAAADLLRKSIVMKNEVNRPRKITIKGKEIVLIPAYHPAASFYNRNVKDSIRESIRSARTYLEDP